MVPAARGRRGCSGSTPGGGHLGSELGGACFDPKGLVLYVSLQLPGITFAIRGPWKSGNL
jgi:secreted PhoX family phosphatase